MFTVILVTLSAFALLSMIFFCRMHCVYNQYANERKQLKREVMAIKDTEYTNFLMQENANIKRATQKEPAPGEAAATEGDAVAYRTGINSSVNESVLRVEDGVDDSD